jgi:quercetin dioxygenase-like cupin family protein
VPELITQPAVIPVPGDKTIEEFVGRVVQGEQEVSIARMVAPPGWSEPAQQPAFTEYTVVLEGCLVVDTDTAVLEVQAGQAVIARAGERVRYRTDVGATYIAVCLPAFSPDSVHRD